MTTNKPGSVNQQPLYGCTNCYEDYTWPAWPAEDLRVYDNECWCELCWDERRCKFPDQPGWNDLESYTPALQAEYDRLSRYYKNGIECFANPCERHSGERTPPFSDFFEKYGGQCLICVVDNNKTLQANIEELRRALAESQANDRQAMAYLNEVRALVGGDDFPDMVERAAKLQAERDKLREEVLRLRVAMAKAAQRADDWPDSNDDPADVLSDCASILFDALDYRHTSA